MTPMRLLKVGLLFLLMLPAIAVAQVSGTVESIGFASYFRPDSWTPMVITVTPETAKTTSYLVRVKLQDLDRDLPIYQRAITVTGAAEGQNRTQRFRMYFIPPPTERGLPDASDAGALKELQDRLKVSIYTDAANPKWICDLPITGALQSVEPTKDAYPPATGTKLLIAVSDGNSKPIFGDPRAGRILGFSEGMIVVNVRSAELPESVLGYDGVDGIIWLDADPASLKSSGDEKFRGLEQYVRRGGKLVICQPAEWQKTLGFDELLPLLRIEGVHERQDLAALNELAAPGYGSSDSYRNADEIPPELKAPFSLAKGPFQYARGVPKPDALVDEATLLKWPIAGSEGQFETSPYIVRRSFGLGAVTWVAQDLGDPSITQVRFGWPYVWNRVFDWKNTPLPVYNTTEAAVQRRVEQGNPIDLGKSLIGSYMELQSKSAGLIALAVLFFIGYWLLAGPGLYALLASRKKTHLSWFWFGACAFGAMGITVLLVKLVLRGPPDLRHLSIIRIAPDQPAVIISRFGLYIPRDGEQLLELKDAAPQSVTSISALPIHPAFLKDVPEESGSEYTVPIIDATSPGPANLRYSYRSTLKKFQATWVGDLKGKIDGSAKLIEEDFIDGQLTNNSGQQLDSVFIAFNYPGAGALAGDWMLFIPSWAQGVTLDLRREFNKTADGRTTLAPGFDPARPDISDRVRGKLSADWKDYFYKSVRGPGQFSEDFNDSSARGRRVVLPALSFFDRLPLQISRDQSFGQAVRGSRSDLLRRGARMLDLSQVIAAGNMVILAEASGPLPMPLFVAGEQVSGSGLNLYQFVIPLDRSAMKPTTAPSTQEAAN